VLLLASDYGEQKKRKLKPKPDTWDSDFDGSWADNPAATVLTDDDDAAAPEDDDDLASIPSRTSATRGRGRGRGRGGKTTAASTRKTTTAAAKPAPAARGGRTKKGTVIEDDEDDEDDEEDVIMLDDSNDEEELFVKPAKSAKPAPRQPAARTPAKKAPAKSTSTKQSTLNFSQPATQTKQTNRSRKKVAEPVSEVIRSECSSITDMLYQSDDEISDDDDAFEPAPPTTRSTRSRH
jgi:double-strand break repair protein MRE11